MEDGKKVTDNTTDINAKANGAYMKKVSNALTEFVEDYKKSHNGEKPDVDVVAKKAFQLLGLFK